jgi:mannose-6-phosphate isomerase-like protein (cupin superfamily)
VRRIVTGVNAGGRSHVTSSEELEVDYFADVYNFDPAELLATLAGIEDGTTAEWLELPNGGVKVMYIIHPPAAEMTGAPPDLPGLDAEGFHTTRTFDIDYVTHGELTMLLDEERVVLRAGDIVIQRATRHAWRNESQETAGLLAILYTPSYARKEVQ